MEKKWYREKGKNNKKRERIKRVERAEYKNVIKWVKLK